MPVDFGGLFQFATPPFTGGPWLVNGLLDIGMASASAEGRCLSKLLADAERPWEKPDGPLRLSFVHNPIDWLIANHRFSLTRFPTLLGLEPTESFQQYAQQYLTKCPGSITRLFNQYESQVIQRIEDQPMAFAEFAESIGVSDAFVQKIQRRAGPSSASFCGGWLRTELRRADEKIFDLYDYW